MRSALLSTANLRLAGMLVSLVVIVSGAYLVRQRLSADSADALAWVSHTHEVRAAIYKLSSALNAVQVAAFKTKLDGSRANVEEYQRTRGHYTTMLSELRELTRDSAEQQERVGMLRASIEQRLALFDSAVASASVGGREFAAAVERFPIDDVAAAIIAREQALVQMREERAERSLWLARWGTLASTLAQILLLGVIIWISERHQRRRALAELQALSAVGRARLIVETVREPIAVITQDLVLLQVNRAFADFYSLPQPVTGSLPDIPGWTDTALHQRLRDVVAMQRELWDYETVQQIDDGVARHVVVNARPMALPDNAEATALVTLSDQTARKRSEEQILELNRQLSGKIAAVTDVNRELEAFSYSVSHDLRAPLRHVSGFADKLRERVGDAGDEKILHYCDVIADAARRMSTLIEDLLRYSRLGRHALRLQAVDMQSQVEEVQGTLMSGIEDRSIEWRVAPLPVVVADASLLHLVWQNLIDNAIKYSAVREEALIEIGVDELPAERVFWIRDNGTGFDMKHANKLFGVFQRMHKASEFPGSGIGLASVRRIIARHDGRVWAEASRDHGATFFFSLPRHDPSG